MTTSYPRLGGAPTAFSNRSRAAREGVIAFDMIDHCHRIGMGGVQMNPPSTDPETIRSFRQRLESLGMHLVCDPRLPRQPSEVPEFEAQVKAYKDAGAVVFHAAMTGRRYEEFDSLQAFVEMLEGCKRQMELAEPVLRKYRIKLGVENHKGWRSEELANWLRQLGSEWVGVCLDFGNNLSLCEDPLDTARTLVPFACFAHIKDMAVQEYEDGFLLSEVPLGEGIIDLVTIVRMLREVDPDMIIDLEMITRDPLQIPVFTDNYWTTFDDAYSPLLGRDLARVLKLVKENPPAAPLPATSGLSLQHKIRLEDEYNRKCIDYARQRLEL